MELDVRQRERAQVVTVRGQIIAQESVRLGRELERLIQQAPDGSAHLIINLAETPYLDSQGLGALVRAHRRAKDRSARIAVSQAQPNIERLFTVAKLTDTIPIYATDDDALAALAGEPPPGSSA